MKQMLLFLYFYFSFILYINSVSAQESNNVVEDKVGGILVFDSNTDLSTEFLLKILKWNSLNSRDAYFYKDSLLTIYKYRSQGLKSIIDIRDYKNIVLSFNIDLNNSLRPFKSSYFNKKAWLSYAHEYLGLKTDTFSITIEESSNILEAYYILLGVGVTNEYGWICEYGTVGLAPAQRSAVIYLIKESRVDLLRKILNGPNLEGSVYAADALIYIDNSFRTSYKKYEQYLSEKRQELKSLNLDSNAINKEMKSYDKEREFYYTYLLQREDSTAIKKIKLSDRIVQTCGNMGSYKLYPVSTMTLLSDSAISTILDNYENLLKLGYFDQ